MLDLVEELRRFLHKGGHRSIVFVEDSGDGLKVVRVHYTQDPNGTLRAPVYTLVETDFEYARRARELTGGETIDTKLGPIFPLYAIATGSAPKGEKLLRVRGVRCARHTVLIDDVYAARLPSGKWLTGRNDNELWGRLYSRGVRGYIMGTLEQLPKPNQQPRHERRYDPTFCHSRSTDYQTQVDAVRGV